jgi:integrase/recombinase XerC
MMWIQSFVDYLRYERNLSERTIKGYSAGLEAFERFFKRLDAELCWENLDEDVIRDWMMAMMEEGNRTGSICCRLSSVRAFYKFLLKRGLVDRNPAHLVVAPKREKNLPIFVREDQMDRLLDGNYFPEDFVGVRDRLILLAFYSTGMRLSELTGLALDDVDCKQSQVRVTGKRNKQRVIPFGTEMMSSILRYLAMRHAMLMEKGIVSNWFFVSEKSGGRMPDSKVRQIVQAYLGQVTTLRKKSPHVLRHSFATSMLNHRADLQSVKELLGHERLSTTEIYTHTTFEELKDMYNQAHPRAPKK